MHGMHVHEAVAKARETETGITIHYVDERYDEGDIIAQFKVALEKLTQSQRIAEKIAKLEAEHFPEVVEKTILQLLYVPLMFVLIKIFARKEQKRYKKCLSFYLF